jgi:ubiquinone/menaquinone biosynthesis C-methylase UbiE
MHPTGGAALQAADHWEPLKPLMAAHRVTLDPPAFFAAVSRAFHGCGAESYDTLNRHMWQSLPDQFQHLVSDLLQQFPPPNHRMTALDIGCGTGMSAELLLRTRMGAFVRQVDLVDPAQGMLQICSMRQSLLSIRHRLMCGQLETLPLRPQYDMIVAGSVLQHVGDLPEFLRQVSLRQSPGGVFMHLQDPNADSHEDPERQRRVEQFQRSRRGLIKRLSRTIRKRGTSLSEHVDAINKELLELKIVNVPLSEDEIAETVRLRTKDGHGISVRQLKTLLPEYRLVSSRSWAFFGELSSALPPVFRRRERALVVEQMQNGTQVGAVWIKGQSANPTRS